MKKINCKSIILMTLAILLLILKLVFFDRDVLSIILSSAYLGFFLITGINYLRKKETKVEKYYLKIILLLLVLTNLVQTGILLFSGKNIVNSLFNFVVLWMMLNSSSKLLNKKEYNAKKVFIASIILILVPYFEKLNLELLINILTSLVIILFFNGCKDSYFGLFDPSLVNSEKKKFKITQWIKTILIILVGIIFLYLPVLGSILTVLLWFLCFGGFFDNLILILEQKIFNKKLRKNKEFIICKEVYSLAPIADDYLKKRMEVVAKKKFLEVGIPYEVYALMELIGERKFESFKSLELVPEHEFSSEVEKLFNKRVRPELISKLLIEVYTDKKKIVKKIEKATSKFNEEYIKVIDEENDTLDKICRVNELYDLYFVEIMDIVK